MTRAESQIPGGQADGEEPEGGEAPCSLPPFAEAMSYEPGESPDRMPGEILGYSVTVGLLEVDLMLPLCHSLKEKRGILAKTMNHVRKKHAVSVAEVARHDTWGRAGLAVTTVSGSRDVAEQTLRAVAHTLEREREVQLVDWSVELM
jgi:hypothetical protein